MFCFRICHVTVMWLPFNGKKQQETTGITVCEKNHPLFTLCMTLIQHRNGHEGFLKFTLRHSGLLPSKIHHCSITLKQTLNKICGFISKEKEKYTNTCRIVPMKIWWNHILWPATNFAVNIIWLSLGKLFVW